MLSRPKHSKFLNIIYFFVYFIYKIGCFVTAYISLILKVTNTALRSVLKNILLRPANYILYSLIYFLKNVSSIGYYLTDSFSSAVKKTSSFVSKAIISKLDSAALAIKKIFNAIIDSLKSYAGIVYHFIKLIVFLPKSLFVIVHRSAMRIEKDLFITFYAFKKLFKLAPIKKIKTVKKTPKKNWSLSRLIPVYGKAKHLVLIGTITVISIFFIVLINFLNTVPNPKTLADFSSSSSSQIFDKDNTLLFNSYSKQNRIPVSLSDVSPVLIKATVYSEDGRFYSHFGVDPIAIARSVFHNLFNESTQGGSTITQQLAKNVFLTSEKSLSRKLEEALLAFRIEHNFSKDQILELYINAVSYGGDTVGVEAAAQRYFGKKAKDLSSKEAIYLASITSAPSIYGPAGNDRTSYKLKEQEVLEEMVSKKEITENEMKKIQEEKLVFNQPAIYKRAPHAVDYAIDELPKYITNAKNASSGFLVKTTIDLPLQNYIQQNLILYITKERANNINNAGVIVIDPKTGAILAMVGSANYFDEGSGQYNTVLAKRQLGSAVKLVTYALALDTTHTPTSTIIDRPTSFSEFPGYNPRNYDGKFHGTVSLKSAFANSYNIPALKLAYGLGLRNVADQGVAMGIPEFEFKDDNIPLSFVIGGVELPLAHLASAYSVVANEGRSVNLHIIDSVTDYEENIIYKSKSEATKQVISQKTANSIFTILADSNARRPAFGYSTDFDFGANQVAIKTGTSNDNKDNVAMAFTKDFVVGVWVGNNNGESMNNISSGFVGATNIMHTVVTKVLDNLAHEKDGSIYALENKKEGR